MYRTMESVDEALNYRPHVLDGKEVDPKRAVAKEVCDMAEYIDVVETNRIELNVIVIMTIFLFT